MGAAKVDAGDVRVTAEKLIEGGVKGGEIASGWGPEQGEVGQQLGEGVRDKEGCRQSNFAKRGGGERKWLKDEGGEWE